MEECIKNEIEVLTNINNPHIIKFIEMLKTDNHVYFIYEYCNQGNLKELIVNTNGHLPESEALYFFK